MRRRFVWVSVLALALSAGACGDSSSNNGDGGNPDTASGDLGAPTQATIAMLTSGQVADGTNVIMSNLVVTATDLREDFDAQQNKINFTGDVYVQDEAGGKGSGIRLFNPLLDGGLQLTDLQLGDKVTVVGVYTEWPGPQSSPFGNGQFQRQIVSGMVQKTGTGTAPTPSIVTPAELLDDTDGPLWSNVLVRVENVKATSDLNSQFKNFFVSGGLQVDDDLYLHTPTIGECLNITGVSIFFFGHRLHPRDAGDVSTSTSCAPALQLSISELQDPAAPNHPTMTNVEVEVTGIVTALDTTPSSTSNQFRGFYIQEEGSGGGTHGDGFGLYKGVYVFHSWDAQSSLIPPAIGNKVTVTGLYDEFNMLTEIKNVSAINDQGAATPIQPVMISVDDLLANKEKYQGTLVTLNEAVQVAALVQVSGMGFTVKIGGTAKALEIRNSLFDFFLPTPPAVDDTYTSITGIVSSFNDEYRIEPRQASDLVKQ